MGEGYDAFLKMMLRAFGAGTGQIFEQVSGDLSGVNYSSIRAGMVEFRRATEMFQHAVFVFQFCRAVWERWMDEAVLAGALPISPAEYRRNRRKYLKVNWVPQGWAWVDPQKEVQAYKDTPSATASKAAPASAPSRATTSRRSSANRPPTTSAPTRRASSSIATAATPPAVVQRHFETPI